MRKMSVYIHQLPHWPKFSWNQESLTPLLAYIRNRQGRLMGRMEAMGFQSVSYTHLDVYKRQQINYLGDSPIF